MAAYRYSRSSSYYNYPKNQGEQVKREMLAEVLTALAFHLKHTPNYPAGLPTHMDVVMLGNDMSSALRVRLFNLTNEEIGPETFAEATWMPPKEEGVVNE